MDTANCHAGTEECINGFRLDPTVVSSMVDSKDASEGLTKNKVLSPIGFVNTQLIH